MFEFLGRMQKGSHFISSMLTGDFDESPVERQFAMWFMERPARSKQRDIFVKITTGVGGPRGIVAERLIDSITKVWRGGGAQFGDLLARQLDELIVFTPPTTAEQVESQPAALKNIGEIKAMLRDLDEAPVEAGIRVDPGPDTGKPKAAESPADIADDIVRVLVTDVVDNTDLDEKTNHALPAAAKHKFTEKARTYRIALVLAVLLNEERRDSTFLEVRVKFEARVFGRPSQQGIAFVETVSRAVSHLGELLAPHGQRKQFTWASEWLAEIGADVVNPATLMMFVMTWLELFTIVTDRIREMAGSQRGA